VGEGEGDARVTDRRAFISQMAMAAASVALAGCVSGLTAPETVSGSIKVSDYNSLANTNGVALVTVSGAQLAIVRTSATSFAAFSRTCPHQGATIDSNGNGFTCPRHQAQFDLAGKWVGGRATGNLHSYNTSYDATTGTLTIG
jgi:Rieske Fe-S protein